MIPWHIRLGRVARQALTVLTAVALILAALLALGLQPAGRF